MTSAWPPARTCSRPTRPLPDSYGQLRRSSAPPARVGIARGGSGTRPVLPSYAELRGRPGGDITQTHRCAPDPTMPRLPRPESHRRIVLWRVWRDAGRDHGGTDGDGDEERGSSTGPDASVPRRSRDHPVSRMPHHLSGCADAIAAVAVRSVRGQAPGHHRDPASLRRERIGAVADIDLRRRVGHAGASCTSPTAVGTAHGDHGRHDDRPDRPVCLHHVPRGTRTEGARGS